MSDYGLETDGFTDSESTTNPKAGVSVAQLVKQANQIKMLGRQYTAATADDVVVNSRAAIEILQSANYTAKSNGVIDLHIWSSQGVRAPTYNIYMSVNNGAWQALHLEAYITTANVGGDRRLPNTSVTEGNTYKFKVEGLGYDSATNYPTTYNNSTLVTTGDTGWILVEEKE